MVEKKFDVTVEVPTILNNRDDNHLFTALSELLDMDEADALRKVCDIYNAKIAQVNRDTLKGVIESVFNNATISELQNELEEEIWNYMTESKL